MAVQKKDDEMDALNNSAKKFLAMTDAENNRDATTQAKAALDAYTAQKPGAYQSQYQDEIANTVSQILNRDKFSYNINDDSLYEQYKNNYIQQGRLAMQDTMGQAAALTGGYGNSYAAAAGNQAYQGYLQQLNDVAPQLEAQAYDRYNQEGQDLYNQYSLLSEQDQQDYGKYQDKLSSYYSELENLTNQYNNELTGGQGTASTYTMSTADFEKLQAYADDGDEEDFDNYITFLVKKGLSMDEAIDYYDMFFADSESKPKNDDVVDTTVKGIGGYKELRNPTRAKGVKGYTK